MDVLEETCGNRLVGHDLKGSWVEEGRWKVKCKGARVQGCDGLVEGTSFDYHVTGLD